jgi:hypothetical protein
MFYEHLCIHAILKNFWVGYVLPFNVIFTYYAFHLNINAKVLSEMIFNKNLKFKI